ncbi:MAG: hypothetical protein AAGE85_06780 [Pseudomonadota bacterium]
MLRRPNTALTAACAFACLFACLLAAPQPVQAMTVDEAFADGNRLFRDDLYWAALLRYRQAREGGLNTPTLAYNTGVAHYRAGQHIRAREVLLEAVADPQFRVAAQYNLGLNAYALGDMTEALRWLRLARDQQSDPKLSRYASAAILRLDAGVAEEVEAIEERAAVVQKTRRFSNLKLRARVSFGTDDNPFMTPDQAYVDLADPDQPVVTPEAADGAFVPVALSAKYLVNALKDEGFFLAYRLAGRYYQDKNLENANEYIHEGSFGSEYRRTVDGRTREVFSAFRFAQSDETYYDPDDGTVRSVDELGVETEIADRLNYTRYGPELTFRQDGERLGFGLSIKGQLWDYEDVELVPSYDHEYFQFEGSVQYKLAATSLLRISANRHSRRFSDRPSFDADANQFITNPAVRYDYLDLGVTARQRVTRRMWFGANYIRSERTDRFVGYNDYGRDTFGVDFQWSIGYRFRIELEGQYRLYDYPNAFAFNNPVAGRKTREDAFASLNLSYRLTRSLTLNAEARMEEVVSNDARIAYERNQFVLGIRWEPADR